MERVSRSLVVVLCMFLAIGCLSRETGHSKPDFDEPSFGRAVLPGSSDYDSSLDKALFAGGCFWCVETAFEHLDGVVASVSGYAGGKIGQPTYRQVGSGTTGYTESVLVIYDPTEITYEELLDAFWRAHDPTDSGGQFIDRGSQYRPEIFVYDESQRAAAERSKQALAASGRLKAPIVTPITDATPFWPAEDEHQDFYEKDPERYEHYRFVSGRDPFIERVWGRTGS